MKLTSITYRLFSITMAILMFISSTGFTVDMHYCQGELKTISFFGKAKSCHEIGKGMKGCKHHKKMMENGNSQDNKLSKRDCCTNKTVHFQSGLDQQLQANNALLANTQLQHFVLAYAETFLKSAIIGADKPTYAHYKPPLIPRDIYVLLETFLL